MDSIIDVSGVISEDVRDEVVGSIVDTLEELRVICPEVDWEQIDRVEILIIPKVLPENETHIKGRLLQ